MASVWKHHRSPYWTVIYRDETGKWRRFITRERNREKAKRIAHAFEDLHTQAREQKLTKEALEKAFRGMIRRTFGDDDTPSVETFFRNWIREKELDNRQGTAARYKTSVDRFLKFLGPKSAAPITSIEPGDCHAFYGTLKADRLAPASIIAEIKTLRGVFNTAQQRLPKQITFNPAAGVKLPKRFGQVKRKTFTTEQVEIILREADTEWKTATLLGYYAGLRLGDAVSCRWENVDLAHGHLHFAMQKTGAELLVPLHPVLEQHLSDMAADAGGLLSPKLAGQPVSGKKGLSQQFLALMRKAGISQESQFTGGKRQLSTLSFHSLRKTFNSELAASGVSQELRKKLTGHKSDTMNDRYTEIRIANLREAVNKLPKLGLVAA